MISGIICEFNPFHQGHKHLIDCIKANNDSVVCVMSGNLVQRGEFAIYNKFDRAKKALDNGADLVIEMPCVNSTLSAEGFAKAGVEILEATGIIDQIVFGAECDDIEKLKDIANQISIYDKEIKEELKKGTSYPVARRNVINSDILDYPNNILAIEYIKASSIPCKAIKRIGKGHDTDDDKYSASAIRKSLPLSEICSMKNCESAILSKLRTMTADDFLQIDDVSEGLENRIVTAVRSATSLDELYDLIKTKRYTHSRIRRIILRSYLGITKDYSKSPSYIRILGFNDKGKELIAKMKRNSNLPIISRYADIDKLDNNGKALLELECRCTDLYNLGFNSPLPCGTEQTSKIIIKKTV